MTDELPKSKWSKTIMIDAIVETLDDDAIDLTDEQAANLRRMPREIMFEKLFELSSVRPTSKYRTMANFYSPNPDAIIEAAENTSFDGFYWLSADDEPIKRFKTKKQLESYMTENGLVSRYVLDWLCFEWYVNDVRYKRGVEIA